MSADQPKSAMLLTVFDKSAENTDISRNFPKKFSVCTRYRFKRNIRKNIFSKINCPNIY